MKNSVIIYRLLLALGIASVFAVLNAQAFRAPASQHGDQADDPSRRFGLVNGAAEPESGGGDLEWRKGPLEPANELRIAPMSGLITQSWQGLRPPAGAQQWPVPGDPTGAAGPAGILETVNLQIAYYSKSGSAIWGPVDITSSFWSVAGFESDPKTLFDGATQRFFVIMQESTAATQSCWLNVAVSRSPDPKSGTAADWYFYRFNVSQSDVNEALWNDYPGIAMDSRALYVSYNMVGFGSGVTHWTSLLVLDKNQLISGSGRVNRQVQMPWGETTIVPVTPRGAADPGNVLYLVESWDATTLKVYAVSDPLGAATVASQLVVVNDYGWGATTQAPQLGGYPVDAHLPAFVQGGAFLVSNDLWFADTRGNPDGPSVAVYYRLRLNGWPRTGAVSAVEDGTLGDPSYWNFQPAIGVNDAGDICVTWTRCSASSYPAMMYATRLSTEVAFGTPQIVKSSATDGRDIRWGDYASVAVDPTDCSFWAVNQWVASNHTWSTWWAKIQVPACDVYVKWSAPASGADGTLAHPFTTVTAGYTAMTRGFLHVFGGQYNETLLMNKPILVNSYDGLPVIVGIP